MHCDTISELYNSINTNINTNTNTNTHSLRSNHFHIDLNKMKAGNYLVQNFGLYVNLNGDDDPLERCLKLIDLYYNEIEKNKDIIAPALTGDDILTNESQGKMSSLLTIEEGGVTKASLSNLRNFYRLGVRMLTLTWNYENEIGHPAKKLDITNPIRLKELHRYEKLYSQEKSNKEKSSNETNEQGLKEYGIYLIEEMESLGMIIDVSHLSDSGIRDVYKYTKKPFVASHSNSRTICNHPRNLPDDLIKKMADRGCVIGINFYPPFLEENLSDNKESGTIKSIINHIKHIINIGGPDCIGLGSDFDGIPGHGQLRDGSYMPLLAAYLEDAGISHNTIEKIFYKNVLNLYMELL